MKKFSLLGLSLILGLGIAACGGSDHNNGFTNGGNVSVPSGGNYPEGIGIDASGHVWVANQFSNIVVEFNANGSIMNSFTVGIRPHGVKIDRGGTGNIWVQNTAGGGPSAPACPNNTTGTMTALNPDGSLMGTFCTNGDQPQHAQFDSSSNVWVTNQASNTVAELSSAGAPINVFPTGVNPHAITSDQAGNFWIGNYGSNSITVLDPSGSLLTTILNAGLQPTGNSIDPSGNLWQSMEGNNLVSVFAAAPSFQPLTSHTVGIDPRGVSIDKAGNVFVANRLSNDVFKFDSSGNQVATYKVGGCPENMAIDSSGNVWVTNACSNTLNIIKGVAVPSPNGDSDSNG
jgi:streptogramin lyase